MTLVIFAQVFTVCLLGAMSPGPSMAVVINNAIFKGRYNGILTSIGHGIGIAFYATFAVLGLGLIINTNIFIFNGLKILSIIFLIFIGAKSILNKEKLNLGSKEVEFHPEISEFRKLEKVSGHLESDFISIDNVFDISDNSDLNEIIIIAKTLRNIH